MRHVPPKRSPFFKLALTQWLLGLCVATHRPLSSVTQRPPISDLSPKDPQFLICQPKTHHFSHLAQTLISHNIWSQEGIYSLWSTWCLILYKSLVWRKFSNSVDQSKVPSFASLASCYWKIHVRFTTLSLKDPIIFDMPLKEPLFFGCFCHRKTPMSEVLGGTCMSLWYMSAPPVHFLCKHTSNKVIGPVNIVNFNSYIWPAVNIHHFISKLVSWLKSILLTSKSSWQDEGSYTRFTEVLLQYGTCFGAEISLNGNIFI